MNRNMEVLLEKLCLHLRWISLTDNKIGDKGADAIAAMLKVNHTLTHL